MDNKYKLLLIDLFFFFLAWLWHWGFLIVAVLLAALYIEAERQEAKGIDNQKNPKRCSSCSSRQYHPIQRGSVKKFNLFKGLRSYELTEYHCLSCQNEWLIYEKEE